MKKYLLLTLTAFMLVAGFSGSACRTAPGPIPAWHCPCGFRSAAVFAYALRLRLDAAAGPRAGCAVAASRLGAGHAGSAQGEQGDDGFFIHISLVYWYARSLCDPVGARGRRCSHTGGHCKHESHLIV